MKNTMKKFLIVYHEWWMDTGRFSNQVIEDLENTRVHEIAGAESHRRSTTFNKCDYTIVELIKGEKPLTNPRRKLSWYERISGFTTE